MAGQGRYIQLLSQQPAIALMSNQLLASGLEGRSWLLSSLVTQVMQSFLVNIPFEACPSGTGIVGLSPK